MIVMAKRQMDGSDSDEGTPSKHQKAITDFMVKAPPTLARRRVHLDDDEPRTPKLVQQTITGEKPPSASAKPAKVASATMQSEQVPSQAEVTNAWRNSSMQRKIHANERSPLKPTKHSLDYDDGCTMLWDPGFNYD